MGKENEIISTSYTPEELYSVMYRADQGGAYVAHIRGELCSTTDSFFREISSAMRFPHYFGWNWAAFDECITDLEWLKFSCILIVIDDHEELFADVKELMETSNKLLTELADELNIPVDDLKQQISEEVADIKLAATEVKEEIPDNLPDTNAAEVSSVEVEKEVPKQETKREGTDRNESNNQMNFAQSIIDNLKSTVEDVQAEMPVTYTTTSMEDIMEQVTENLKVNMKEDLTEMEMQLHPASLGNVKIQVAARDGVITANFTTQNETVKEVLESQIVQLKEQMNEQGIKVEAVEVTVNTNAFERNFNDERDQSQRESENEAKRKRVRGINLTGADALSLDEMDEEDRVTADMMARQGNTVDYLA